MLMSLRHQQHWLDAALHGRPANGASGSRAGSRATHSFMDLLQNSPLGWFDSIHHPVPRVHVASSPKNSVRSLDADAMMGSLGWKATLLTLPLWPGSL